MVATINRASDGIGLQWKHTLTEYSLADVRLLVSGQKTTAKIIAAFETILQAELDTRIPRSSLPDDEDTKFTDPAQPNFFWDGDDLVARSETITIEFIDGKYLPTVRSV